MPDKTLNMDARTNFLRSDARVSASYARAVNIFAEKREIFARLGELNRELRELQHLDADAVAAARIDIPFRSSPGRKKSK